MRLALSSTPLQSYASGGTPPEEYLGAREKLQRRLAASLRSAMATLVGNMENADLVLVSADGKRIPAHECILRARAPGFYQRHVEATVAAMEKQRMEHGGMREVAIGDIDSAGLEFFIHSVYTEDEIAQLPTTDDVADRRDSSSRQSRRSFDMEDSTTDFEEFRSDMEDSTHRENSTPAPQGDQPGGGHQHHQQHPQQQLFNPHSSPQRRPMPQQIQGQPLYPPYPGSLQRSFPPPVYGGYPGYPIGQPSLMPGSHAYLQSEAEMAPTPPMRMPLSRQGSAPIYATPSIPPSMTSFRDLATGSPLGTSIYSLGGRSEIGPDIPEEEEDGGASGNDRRDSGRTEVSMSKFIRLDSLNADPSRSQSPAATPTKRQKAIFPMFIGLGDGDGEDRVPEGIRGRAMMAKRLSVASLTSLTSIDVMTTSEVHLDPPEKHPSCRLAADLLQMYLDNLDTDVVVRTENGDLFAHKCILSALSPYFKQQLHKSPQIEMKGYSKNTVHFLLSFMYGGVTCIPDEVDIWEVVSLATHLNLKNLVDVVMLHLKMTKCHFFHRPCSGCVSAVFDALPQLQSIRCLKPLFDEAMQWQARHFARIWKGRVFLHLSEKWRKECFEAVIAYMDDETLIDIILGCERLQTCLPRGRAEGSQEVTACVNEILEMALQFLAHSAHLVVTSRAFAAMGKGLALNVGLLEDLLPPLIHTLSADIAVKTYIGLNQLREELRVEPSRSDDRTERVLEGESNPRFVSLVYRLTDLVDKHLLHFAASVVRCESFGLLSPDEQRRIQETGLFVEMGLPKATPPRLSSFYRTYKRSASAGVQPMSGHIVEIRQRTQSIEREKLDHLLMDETPRIPSAHSSPRRNPLPFTSQAPLAKEKIPKEEFKIEEQRSKIKETSGSRGTSPRGEGGRAKAEGGEGGGGGERGERREEKEHPLPSSKQSAADEPSTSHEPSAAVPPPSHPVPTEAPLPPPTRAVLSKSNSREGRRSPAKAPSTRPRAIETEEGGRFERQQTHTIMQSSEAAKAAAAMLPGPSPKKNALEKPKSVVKPMQQESLAKERPLPRVAPPPPAATLPGQAVPPPPSTPSTASSVTSRLSQSTKTPATRSSIPRKATAIGTTGQAKTGITAKSDVTRRRQPETTPTAAKNARKTVAN